MNNSLKAYLCDIAYSPLGDKIVTGLGFKRLWTELHVRSSKKRLLADARSKFKSDSSRGSIEDYVKALDKHWVSYTEYAYEYEFFNKTEEERDEYVSRLRMAYFYWRYAPGVAKGVFRNKTNFLRYFKDNIHREWLYAPDSTFNDFVKLVNKYDCIIKPCDGKLGRGVSKVYRDKDHNDDRELYEDCKKNRMLVEQCIEACEELKALHPESLNTIRVVTVANKEKACVFSGVLRTGVGDSVVDNSHAGGVSAQINIYNGLVETEGANTKGEKFSCHPDSGIRFIGYQVPRWNEIVETVCNAAKLSGNPITGWDVVVNSDGKVEFIEGNYGPDLDMMQARYGRGVKRKVYSLIKDYFGIGMK